MSILSEIRDKLKTMKTYDQVEMDLLKAEIARVEKSQNDKAYLSDPEYPELLREVKQLNDDYNGFQKSFHADVPIDVIIECERNFVLNYLYESGVKPAITVKLRGNPTYHEKNFFKAILDYGTEGCEVDQFAVEFNDSIYKQWDSLDNRFYCLRTKIENFGRKYGISKYWFDFAADMKRLGI